MVEKSDSKDRILRNSRDGASLEFDESRRRMAEAARWTPGGINAPDSPSSSRITVAADDAGIYDSFREGEFSYRVPLPNGRYRVTLKFQEPAAGAAGVRAFDVQVNGKIVLRRFDIFAAAGGKLKAVDRAFDTTSRDGGILIEFSPLIGKALVSALSIESLDLH